HNPPSFLAALKSHLSVGAGLNAAPCLSTYDLCSLHLLCRRSAPTSPPARGRFKTPRDVRGVGTANPAPPNMEYPEGRRGGRSETRPYHAPTCVSPGPNPPRRLPGGDARSARAAAPR